MLFDQTIAQAFGKDAVFTQSSIWLVLHWKLSGSSEHKAVPHCDIGFAVLKIEVKGQNGRASPGQPLFLSFSTLQSGVWSQLWLIRHPGLKAQVYVVCNKTKLVGILLEK